MYLSIRFYHATSKPSAYAHPVQLQVQSIILAKQNLFPHQKLPPREKPIPETKPPQIFLTTSYKT